MQVDCLPGKKEKKEKTLLLMLDEKQSMKLVKSNKQLCINIPHPI